MIPSPVLPYGNDSIRTPEGLQCSSTVAPSSYVDVGLYHEDTDRNNQDKGVYVRVLVPLYSGVGRVDCSKLYEQLLKERDLENKLNDLKSEVFK